MTHKNPLVALATACVLVMQMLFAGVAVGQAATSDIGGGFGVTCAPQGRVAPDGGPVAPKTHSHGLCCILHHNALLGFEPVDAPSVKIAAPIEVVASAPTYRGRAPRDAPELASLSPRAPPLRQL